MKKRFIYGTLFVLLTCGGFIAWMVFGPTVESPQGKYFFIRTGSNYHDVKTALLDQKIISGGFFFDRLARQAKYPASVRAGRYEIKNGMSLYNLVRMLRSGRQSPVNFTITKLRTTQDLAARIAANFEAEIGRAHV